VSVTTTITIEAEDRHQLGEILSAIGGVLANVTSPSVSFSMGEPETSDPLTSWYAAHGREFLARLTDNARRALAVIVSSSSDFVPFGEVSAAIDKRGTALAGTLASIGIATKSLNAPGAPFERDTKRKTYWMSEPLRAVFSELLGDGVVPVPDEPVSYAHEGW
jgi:hypothetical protein